MIAMIKEHLRRFFYSRVWNHPDDYKHLKYSIIGGTIIGIISELVPALRPGILKWSIIGFIIMAPIALMKRE